MPKIARCSARKTIEQSLENKIFIARRCKGLAEYYGHLPKHDSSFPLIYSQKSYKPFSPNSLCQVFSRIYIAAGLKGATSHSGRRTFITKLASKGVSAKVLMELAGHKHLSTTQRYIEVNDQMLKEAVELA